MGKKNKNKKFKNRHLNSIKIDHKSTANPSDIHKAALQVFGSTYFTLPQS